MNQLQPIAQAVRAQGRGNDTQLIHMTPNEVQGLQALAKAHGGSLSINPTTGLPEAGFLDSVLPTVLGVGLAAATGGTSLALTPAMIGLGIGGLQYARTGSLEKGLMAGLGAWGGAGMAGSLGLGAAGAGAAGAATPAASVAAAPVNQAAAAANTGIATQGASGLGVTGTQTAATNNFLSNAGMTSVPQASVAPQAFSALPQTTTAMPTIMDKLGSGQFWKDNWKYAGAAAAPAMMGMLGTPTTGTAAPVDNEQYQYTYNPNRASEEDIAAQRAANPQGELTYFRPSFEGPRKVRVAQGGELNYANGGIFGIAADKLKELMGKTSAPTPEYKYEYDPSSQTYTRHAEGGIAGLAAGGMAKGGFVVPADVVSALGNGSTDAGLRTLQAKMGAVNPIKGNGDGLSDSIPTNIDGKQPARVADGEAYIPPETVAKIGGGDPKKGAKKLYAMMDKIRQQAHGKTTQQRKVNAKAVV